ncbi:type II toxin-antitoxin system RelE/ParE family toxin [Leeuwenhoekiella sp. A16]|uniref:type II toxin-antitoxin system RelE/ParE family toxin n=1 Tax=unclassified Leeuwenhoekiella TaxID=2615029 RepID=UPI003A810D0E
MSRRVVVSKNAEKKLNNLFDYLTENWSLTVKSNFVNKLDKNIKLIQKHPESFPESVK